MKLAEGGGGGSFTIYLPIFFKWVITLAVIVNIQPLFIMVDSIASQLTTNLIAVAAKNAAYAASQKISLNFSGGIWVILFQFIVMLINFIMAIVANVSIILLIALRNFEMLVLYVLAPMALVALATENSHLEQSHTSKLGEHTHYKQQSLQLSLSFSQYF